MLPFLLWVRTFLLGADAAAGRDALGLGSMSTQNSNAIQASGNIDANSNKVINLTSGSADSDAANVGQMNTAINSAVTALDWKNSARAGTTAALAACTYANGSSGVGATLTGNSNGALAAQDGITLVVNDYLLVKNQGTGAQNGKYKVSVVGDGSAAFVLTRSVDFDSASEVTPQAAVALDEGSTQAGYIYKVSTTGSITIGTTAVTFAQVGSLSLGSATPQALGSASAGSSSAAAKDDHVHPTTGLVLADGTGLTAQLATTGRKLSINAVSSSATANALKDIQACNCGAGAITLTLPASTGDGTMIRVKRIGSNSVNTLTIDGDGAETVEDFSGAQVASFTMVLGEGVILAALASGKWYRV
jgi:hypothetical protein